MDLCLLSIVFPTTWCKRIWKRSYGLGDIAFFQYESRKDSLHACFLVGGGGTSCDWLSVSNFACMSLDQQVDRRRACAFAIANTPCYDLTY